MSTPTNWKQTGSFKTEDRKTIVVTKNTNTGDIAYRENSGCGKIIETYKKDSNGNYKKK